MPSRYVEAQLGPAAQADLEYRRHGQRWTTSAEVIALDACLDLEVSGVHRPCMRGDGGTLRLDRTRVRRRLGLSETRPAKRAGKQGGGKLHDRDGLPGAHGFALCVSNAWTSAK